MMIFSFGKAYATSSNASGSAYRRGTDLSAGFYRPWSLYNALLLAWEWSQTDRILFGTDWPVTTARETMDGLRSLNRFAQGGNPRIPEEVIEGIIHRDSLALLGIQA
jgi:predicted TIM-barrel fold metal-dependent hydrolase